MANWVDEYGDKVRQVWWVEDLATGKESQLYINVQAAARALGSRRWTDPVLMTDVETKSRSAGGQNI